MRAHSEVRTLTREQAERAARKIIGVPEKFSTPEEKAYYMGRIESVADLILSEAQPKPECKGTEHKPCPNCQKAYDALREALILGESLREEAVASARHEALEEAKLAGHVEHRRRYRNALYHKNKEVKSVSTKN